MDYRLSDPRLDPPGHEAQYSERTVMLPDSFWCYAPLTREPAVNSLPALTQGFLTLGCLNNPCKLHDRTLHLWSRVLRELPDARLTLLAPRGKYRARLQQRLSATGVAADRVTFIGMQSRADYLRSYHDIDVGLDTLPYNGHTTSLDSLWMGVPVMTRTGGTSVGRAGSSQLHQLGLAELVADTDEAFVAAVLSLASDRPRLAALRASLRSRLENSPLMDGARFAANVEVAYRRMFEECSAQGQKSTS
jgi:protein O-GlcNAc transferase